MFGPLGFWEILFVLMLALLLFGPRKLPEIGRALGKALGELRRATEDLTRTFNAEVALEEDDIRPTPSGPRGSLPRSAATSVAPLRVGPLEVDAEGPKLAAPAETPAAVPPAEGGGEAAAPATPPEPPAPAETSSPGPRPADVPT